MGLLAELAVRLRRSRQQRARALAEGAAAAAAASRRRRRECADALRLLTARDGGVAQLHPLVLALVRVAVARRHRARVRQHLKSLEYCVS